MISVQDYMLESLFVDRGRTIIYSSISARSNIFAHVPYPTYY